MTHSRNRTAAEWEQLLIIESRVRGFTGEAIGSALAEVRSHCPDSNQTPNQALGDPAQYAASLNLKKDTYPTLDLILITSLGLLAITVLPRSIRALAKGTTAGFSFGLLISLGTMSLLALVTVLVGGRLCSITGRAKPLKAALIGAVAFVALLAGQATLMFAFPTPAVLNAPLMPIIGTLALLASVILSWRVGNDTSELINPLESPTRRGRIRSWLPTIVWPALCLILTIPGLLS